MFLWVFKDYLIDWLRYRNMSSLKLIRLLDWWLLNLPLKMKKCSLLGSVCVNCAPQVKWNLTRHALCRHSTVPPSCNGGGTVNKNYHSPPFASPYFSIIAFFILFYFLPAAIFWKDSSIMCLLSKIRKVYLFTYITFKFLSSLELFLNVYSKK